MHKVILSLGSNVGDKIANLYHAINLMSSASFIEDIIVSDTFHNPAMLPENSPPEWNLDFVNIALVADTKLSLFDFLDMIKNVEKDCGRVSSSRWSPRIIDIDIIFFDDLVIESEKCTVPHKDAINRDFVMIPLLQIAKDFRYPKEGEFYGKTIQEIYSLIFRTTD
jgi:2-amino-4-hydroxy-6-hydroxymethyldihydropteridine diphosphokinase